jgi:hypothetical protein
MRPFPLPPSGKQSFCREQIRSIGASTKMLDMRRYQNMKQRTQFTYELKVSRSLVYPQLIYYEEDPNSSASNSARSLKKFSHKPIRRGDLSL